MDATRLKEILDAVRKQPDLIPQVAKDGTVLRTFCNIGLDRILGLCSVPRMVNKLNGQPLCANDMVEYMEKSTTWWHEVDGTLACSLALDGVLVVAAQRNDNGHGHVAAVYPAAAEHSGSWCKKVPMLNNIGRPNKDGLANQVWKASLCFRTEPKYFATKGV